MAHRREKNLHNGKAGRVCWQWLFFPKRRGTTDWRFDQAQVQGKRERSAPKGPNNKKAHWVLPVGFSFLAERTGLEPATPGVTGRYSNRLNYRSKLYSFAHIALWLGTLHRLMLHGAATLCVFGVP